MRQFARSPAIIPQSETREWGTVSCHIYGAVCVLKFNRPHVLNAVDFTTIENLIEALDYVTHFTDSKVVILTGQGRAFSTGIDLKKLSRGDISIEYFSLWEEAVRKVEMMPKVVVAALHGFALGGGLQLALAADVRVASDDCVLGLPAVNEALIPGLATIRLNRIVGAGRARDLIMTGRSIMAPEALRIGLVDSVCKKRKFNGYISELGQSLARSSTVATIASKRLSTSLNSEDYHTALAEYIVLQTECFHSDDSADARARYLERLKKNSV